MIGTHHGPYINNEFHALCLICLNDQLGVLFLPSVVKNGCGFSCTGNKSSLEVFSILFLLFSLCNSVGNCISVGVYSLIS